MPKTTPTTTQLNFYLDTDLRAGLEALRQRDGVSYSEQLRRALRLWFDAQGLTPKPAKVSARRVRRA